MEKYKCLKILSYEKNIEIEEELKIRKNKYTVINSNYYIHPILRGEHDKSKKYELFCNPISSIMQKSEKIRRNSEEIKEIRTKIPRVAHYYILQNVIVNEIQSTNEVEGVKSTKEEIRSVQNGQNKGKKHKFEDIIKSYNKIIPNEFKPINDYKDIRKLNDYKDIRNLYDTIFSDDINMDSKIDGKYFRKNPVNITKGMKVLHSGIVGEENIIREMEKLIEFMNRKDIYPLIKMAMSHFILEYIHPFYDGNGRFGRFLISSYLSQKLDFFSAVSFSYSVNLKKNEYDKIFIEAEDPKNYGELTNFVDVILDIIEFGQQNIKELFYEAIENMKYLDEKILEISKAYNLSKLEIDIIYMYMQIFTFKGIPISDTNLLYRFNEFQDNKTSVKKFKDAIESLEYKGFLNRIKNKPIIHEISDEFKFEF